ncbi:hypothetical protein BpHYR1_003952 [Brachionus plicatilis]|uniref:Uncharacterized protein n=1 Tax=Brachionus plicatilis TaxID=10195 RepID=A0A3M7PX79_BRAPC|nr:hypothetical protein BpHYR1_003952 [Brachionus plicatilis]
MWSMKNVKYLLLSEPTACKVWKRVYTFYEVSKAGWEKALKFFEELDLVDHADYIPQKFPITFWIALRLLKPSAYEDIPEESEENLANEENDQQGTGDDPERAESGSSSSTTTPDTSESSESSWLSSNMLVRFLPLKLQSGEKPIKIEVNSYFSPPTSVSQFNKE